MRPLLVLTLVSVCCIGCAFAPTTNTQDLFFSGSQLPPRLQKELELDAKLLERTIYIFLESGRLTFENETARKAAIRIIIALATSGGSAVPPDAVIVIAIIYAEYVFDVASHDRAFARALAGRLALAREDMYAFLRWFHRLSIRAKHEYAVLRVRSTITPLEDEYLWLSHSLLRSTEQAVALSLLVENGSYNLGVLEQFLKITEQHARQLGYRELEMDCQYALRLIPAAEDPIPEDLLLWARYLARQFRF